MSDRGGDVELVERAIAGQSAAYGELARRWSGRIVALCHAQVADAGAAEDLAQETLLRGLRGLRTLQRPDVFGSWMCGIARRVCLDWIKSRRRHARRFRTLDGLESPAAPEAPVAAQVETAEGTEVDSNDLLREVEALPEPYRETLMLYYYNEMTYAELGELLGVSAAAVNARLTNARTMLRDRLCKMRSLA